MCDYSSLAETSLAQRFEEQVRKFSGRTVMDSAGRVATYGELNALANISANALLNQFGEPPEQDQFVATLIDQGLPLTTAIYARGGRMCRWIPTIRPNASPRCSMIAARRLC